MPSLQFRAVFWTYVQSAWILAPLSRRKLRIRAVFEPTRLAEQPLRTAYELLVPIKRIQLRSAAEEEGRIIPVEKPRNKGKGA